MALRMSCCATHHDAACTGGANGIGLAICCRLAQEGARVFMADMDEAAAPAALDAVRSAADGDADVHFVQARLELGSTVHLSDNGSASWHRDQQHVQLDPRSGELGISAVSACDLLLGGHVEGGTGGAAD